MKYDFNPLDLWPYVLIALVFLACYSTREKNSSSIIFTTLLIFSVFRYDVGWDYMSYVAESKDVFLDFGASRFEPLGGVILYVAGYLNFFPLIFLAFSTVTLYIYYKAINRYSSNRLMSWLVFYSMPLFFLASLSTLRQSLATAIVFYSYTFALQRKYLQFFSGIAVACMFHESAIAGLFLLPLVMFQFSRLACAGLLAVSFAVSSGIGDIISSFSSEADLIIKLQSYIALEQYKSTLIQYLYYAVGIINILFYRKLVTINDRNRGFITLVNFGLAAFNILSFEPVSALRVSAFYLVFMTYLIPDYAAIFPRNTAKIVNGGLIGFFTILTFFYLEIYITAYQTGVQEKISFLPYRVWLNNF